jgi:hypothetical protein
LAGKTNGEIELVLVDFIFFNPEFAQSVLQRRIQFEIGADQRGSAQPKISFC